MGAIPYGGGLMQSFMAAGAAREKQGQMVEVPPARSWFQNLISTIQNTLNFMPGGGAGLGIAKNVVSGVGGLAGAPEFFGTSWGDTLARAGGLGIRELADRTGILKSTWQSPGVPPEAGYDESAAWGNQPSNFGSRSMGDVSERWGVPQS